MNDHERKMVERDTKRFLDMPRYELRGDDWENGWKLKEESDG